MEKDDIIYRDQSSGEEVHRIAQDGDDVYVDVAVATISPQNGFNVSAYSTEASASYGGYTNTASLSVLSAEGEAHMNNKSSRASFSASVLEVGFSEQPENFELLVANYKKYGQEDKEKLISGLLSQMIENGQYNRKGKDFFELFF